MPEGNPASKKDADLRSNEQIDGLLSALHIEPGLFWARLAVLKWLGPRPNVIVGNARTPHIEELQTTEIERLTRAAAEVEMMAVTLDARDREIERLRAALERIRDYPSTAKHVSDIRTWAEMSDIARDALSGEPDSTSDTAPAQGSNEWAPLENARLIAFHDRLLKRADWLEGEIRSGGSFDALQPRVTECRYLASQLGALIAAGSVHETTAPQAPIAKVIVREDGPADVMLYAPGLPPGEHDLYCEPEAVAPMMRDETKAIQTCPTCGADWYWPTSPSNGSENSTGE